jgi:DNA-directed RNA polymerase subunit RPC12/RpoP
MAIRVATAICDACGREWAVRMEEGLPERCPSCKSRRWNSGNARPQVARPKAVQPTSTEAVTGGHQ